MNFLKNVSNICLNYSNIDLLEDALMNEEGALGPNGQLWVTTGEHTGRAANDKYVVETYDDDMSYGVSGKMMPYRDFESLQMLVNGYLTNKKVYVTYFQAGGMTCRLISELAWHALFVRTMFVASDVRNVDELDKPVDLTIIDVPGCHADPTYNGTRSGTFIASNFSSKLVLIGGTHYAGEIKKSVFSYVSYVAPETGVLPMHSSVTCDFDHHDSTTGNTTVFFGLSGTGKTTLSADSCNGALIGDDEHLWSNDGITNIENGCYAKAINLSQQSEPLIWDACHRFLTILENVRMTDERVLDFSDRSITENTRAAYSLDKIKDSRNVLVNHPKNIIMLTCDAFGVLPAVSKLDNLSAVYHFISGYTAKVAGTERGVSEPTATFSPCFGGPFMPRSIKTYASLFNEKLNKHNPDVWLVNTGWIGGGPGVGKRMDIEETRRIIAMIVLGDMKRRKTVLNHQFNLEVPEDTFNSVPSHAWKNKTDYDKSANELIKKFNDNIKKFDLSDEIVKGGMPSDQ